jgi:predicted alpha/beta hydrolase family esterase
MKCDILIVSGLWNSGPEHWQTHWERKYPAWTRVPHRDWNAPERDEWVDELDAAIATCQGRPILVAHSLGCMLVAQWARSDSHLKVAGAFLVAPSDTEAESYPIDAGAFAPIPLAPLPFPSIVVASANDEYADIERSRAFAGAGAASWSRSATPATSTATAATAPGPRARRCSRNSAAT